MKELNQIIAAHGKKETESVSTTDIRFLTPNEALEIGLGNLFDSRDDARKKYPIAIALGENNTIIKGAIVNVDVNRFNTDSEYKLNTMKSVSELFISQTNTI